MNEEKTEIPKCLECGKELLKKDEIFCTKCELKHYREYMQDIESAMHESPEAGEVY